jgi:hypothetical protein
VEIDATSGEVSGFRILELTSIDDCTARIEVAGTKEPESWNTDAKGEETAGDGLSIFAG